MFGKSKVQNSLVNDPMDQTEKFVMVEGKLCFGFESSFDQISQYIEKLDQKFIKQFEQCMIKVIINKH